MQEATRTGARHWWPLLSALVVLAVLSAHWAAGGPAAADAPATGVPRVGDVARYAVTGPSGASEVAFRWVEPAERLDRFGEVRVVDRAEGLVLRPGEAAATFEVTYAPGETAPLEHVEARPFLAYAPGVGTAKHVSYERLVRSYEPHLDRPDLCVLRAAWQGVPLDDVDGTDVYAACPAARPEAAGDRRASLEDLGEVAAGDLRARAFRADLPVPGGSREMVIHLVDGVPYPVELRLANEGGAAVTYRLVGLVRGDGPTVGAGAPPAATALPARLVRAGATFEDPGRWGVVEGDAPLPFPAREAIERLEREPPTSEVGRYLLTHPDARVVEFRYFEDRHRTTGASGGAPSWTFVLNDEDGDGYRVTVRRAPLVDVDGAPALDAPRPRLIIEGGAVALPPLDPSLVPTRVVAVADAARAWRAVAGEDAPPLNRIHAALQPGLPSPDAEGVQGRDLFVGHVSYGGAFTAGDAEEPAFESDIVHTGLVVDLTTGAARYEYASVSETRHTLDPMGWRAHGGWDAPAPAPHARWLEGAYYAAAAGATVLALAAYYARALLFEAFIPLYSRLTGASVLENPTRARILELVRRDPGASADALYAAAACGRGTMRHHLSILQRSGYVTRVRAGRHTRFFPAGPMPTAAMEREALLRSPSLRRVHEAVARREGVTQLELARALGVSAPAVHHAVSRLEEAGLVRRVREGRSVGVYATRGDAPR